jgi:tRNA threonylcarbamoyladenosine modification (KEOPS) complex Cgi121 subunit
LNAKRYHFRYLFLLTNFDETQLNGNNISSVFRLSNFYVSVFCCGKLESVVGTKLVDQIRHRFENVYIQGFSPEAIFGLQHLVEALKITLEALRRGITAAKRPELDLLLRISCTTQISRAISYAGIKSGRYACFVVFSKNKRDLLKARDYALKSLPEANSTDFNVNASTRNTIAANLGLEAGSNYLTDDTEFLKYLIERAALITKSARAPF